MEIRLLLCNDCENLVGLLCFTCALSSQVVLMQSRWQIFGTGTMGIFTRALGTALGAFN